MARNAGFDAILVADEHVEQFHSRMRRTESLRVGTRSENRAIERTRQRRILLRPIQRKLRATIRAKPSSGNRRPWSTFIPHAQCIRRGSQRRRPGLLLVFPWIPYDLRGGAGNDIVDFASGIGGANFIGVAVLCAGGDDGEGFRGYARGFDG